MYQQLTTTGLDILLGFLRYYRQETGIWLFFFVLLLMAKVVQFFPLPVVVLALVSIALFFALQLKPSDAAEEVL